MAEVQTNVMRVRLKADFDSAKARLTDALRAEGFGMLAEIDLTRTLTQSRSGQVSRARRTSILGTGRPTTGALPVQQGLMMPCSVIITEDEGWTLVSAADPQVMLRVSERPERMPIACEARERLSRAIASLAA